MYLRRQYLNGDYHFIMCESYQDEGCWKHRRLMDLGPDPGKYIEYPGGNSFYINEAVEEELRACGASCSDNDLEELFVPYLDPYIRRIVERFQRGGNSGKRWRGFSSEELMKHHQELHAFDKRRLHYLRCGLVNIGDLDSKPWKFLNVLLEKSRDEIESLIEGMEQELPPDEIRRYLYTALHLQTHFRHLLTRYHPEALDPEKVDRYFLEDLCQLNRDKRFFRGVEDHDPGTLHTYLVKYIILCFDNAFDPRVAWDEYVGDFMWRHQFYRRARTQTGISTSEREACELLGIALEDFQKMDRDELTRCYRRLAKKTHPDTGGDEESFVDINAAYECLLRRKP